MLARQGDSEASSTTPEGAAPVAKVRLPSRAVLGSLVAVVVLGMLVVGWVASVASLTNMKWREHLAAVVATVAGGVGEAPPPGRFDDLPPLPVAPCELIGQAVGMPRCAPRVVIIGAAECGVAALAGMLRAHPSVVVGGAVEGQHVAVLRPNTKVPVDPRKDALFLRGAPPVPDDHLVVAVDVNPLYLLAPAPAAARYKAAFPDAKVVAVVCDPVRRIASQYQYRYATSYSRDEQWRSLDDWVGLANAARLPAEPHCAADQPANPRYVSATAWRCTGGACAASDYTAGLRAWVAAYGNDNVFITEAGALERHPGAVLLQLLRFLRLDPAEVPLSAFTRHRVAARGNGTATVIMSPATCARLRMMYQPHVACLRDAYGHLFYPPLDAMPPPRGPPGVGPAALVRASVGYC